MASLPAASRSDTNNFGQTPNLLSEVDALRLATNKLLNPKSRSELGQFMTPSVVAGLMASMIGGIPKEVRLLDAGAGIGSLTAAAVSEIISRKQKPSSIHATVLEIDPLMIKGLHQTLRLCEMECDRSGVRFTFDLRQEDFLAQAATWLSGGLFGSDPKPSFNLAIQNPPYKKMHAASHARLLARAIGIETSNLYTAFLSATLRLIDDGGQLVAICPRSFCNGPYFRPFRELLLTTMSLNRIHVFQSRQEAFKDDDVLQETVILSARRMSQQNPIEISSSENATSPVTSRQMPMADVVEPNDDQRFIHIRSDDEASKIAEQMASLPCSLKDLGLTVSTGRVVDFRAKEFLRTNGEAGTIPLIYPGDLSAGAVVWPRQVRKPNALHLSERTVQLTVPTGPYVLTKRFSSKEETRRVVAAVFDPNTVPGDCVGFENHLNYFHRSGCPLDADLASGLCAFLNTSLVDSFFRQFNGHTQVNATDLRTLRYPSAETLRTIGRRAELKQASQGELDAVVGEYLS